MIVNTAAIDEQLDTVRSIGEMIMHIQSSGHTTSGRDTSEKRIRDFLNMHPIGVLATVDPDGNPQATVIYFSIQDDDTILFTTKRRTKKNDDLHINDHIVLVVYESPTQTSVQVTGKAKLISDKALAQKSFLHMMQSAKLSSFAGTPPLSKLLAGNYVAYQITVSQMRMAMFMHPSSKGPNLYETVDYIA